MSSSRHLVAAAADRFEAAAALSTHFRTLVSGTGIARLCDMVLAVRVLNVNAEVEVLHVGPRREGLSR
jgi:hypothetical protein